MLVLSHRASGLMFLTLQLRNEENDDAHFGGPGVLACSHAHTADDDRSARYRSHVAPQRTRESPG